MLSSKTEVSKQIQRAVLLALAPVAILICMAAMNGGVALSASAFDSVVLTLKTMLSSTWVIMLATIVLVITVWQLAHGGGYKTVGLVVGVLAVALVGPTFMTTISTSMPNQYQQIQLANAQHHQIAAGQLQASYQ